MRGVAEKAVKENAYHLRHSTAWVVRLGDGTEESHRRMLLRSTSCGRTPRRSPIAGWRETVAAVLAEATLPVPRAAAEQPGLTRYAGRAHDAPHGAAG